MIDVGDDGEVADLGGGVAGRSQGGILIRGEDCDRWFVFRGGEES